MTKDTLFFDDSENYGERINPYLSFANANLGYSLVQAMIEYIDNAVDAKATEVAICFYGNSILIIDNGDGLEDVSDFFNVASIPRKRKKDAIGLFCCGTFSAFSIADRCSFITRKTLEGPYKGISILYNQEKGGIENELLDEDALKKWFEKKEEWDEIFRKWKSIVAIEKIHPEKNNIRIDDESDYLYARLGQRYLKKIIDKSLSIKVWDMQKMQEEIPKEPKVIQFVDPTFFNEKCEGIQSYYKGAFQFGISMREIANEVGENAVDRYYDKYISHYCDSITREMFNNEELLVKYFVLKPIKCYEKFIEENKRYAHYQPGGKSLSSGFYVYRNGIGIGDAAVDRKINVDFKRQEYNRFKAVIESSPVFDELLGINIRKDDFEVVEALAHIMGKKLKESIQNFFYSVENGRKYDARKLGPCIQNLFSLLDDCEVMPKEENESTNESADNPQKREIDKSKLEAVLQGILLFSSLLTTELKETIEKWRKMVFVDEIEYSNVVEQASEVLEQINLADKNYLQDLDNMLKRVGDNQSRRIVLSKKYPFLSEIDEPRNEQETVFFLLRILENSNVIKEADVLGIERIFAYDTSKGIDFIGITDESVTEYEVHINSIISNCKYFDAEKIHEKYQLLINYRYSGVEIKAVISNGMNIGHSLATSRFLVAWKTTVGTDGCVSAEDGKYYKVADSNLNDNGVYLYENIVTKHRINVIVLKEWGIKNDVFRVKNKLGYS